jgi:hypothetical protein
MAEYAGYVAAPNQFDWGKFSKELSASKIQLAEAVRQERAKKKAEFEKKTSETYKEVTDPKVLNNKTVNDFSSDFTLKGRDVIWNAKSKLDPNGNNAPELNRIQTNALNSVNKLSKTIESVAANEKLIQQNADKQSPIGMIFNRAYFDRSRVNDKTAYFDEDGNGWAVQTDIDGKPKLDTKIDPELLQDIQPFSDEKKDYSKLFTDFTTAQVGAFQEANRLPGGAIKTVESINLNKDFANATDVFVGAVTANDLESGRFLTSVGNYMPYDANDPASKKELLSKGIKEDRLIPVVTGFDGLPKVMLSDDQRKAAVDLAKQQVRQRVEVMETLTKPTSSGGGSSATKPTEGSKARASAMETAIAYTELLQKNPYNGFVLNKIKNAYKSDWPVKPVPLVDAKTGELEGFDIFKLNPDGTVKKLTGGAAGSPSGALYRIGGVTQGLFEMLNKDQKRGEESIDWATSLKEYEQSGKDLERVRERVKPSTSKSNAPKETVYVDVATVLENNRKDNPNLTEAQVKADFMSKNKGKKIIWITKK